MATPSQAFSSKRHFHWSKKVGTDHDDHHHQDQSPQPSTNNIKQLLNNENNNNIKTRKKLHSFAISRLRSAIALIGRTRTVSSPGLRLGHHIVGTLFGSRRGHVHFVFQKDPNSPPAFLVELATPISGLVREMASGLVRIALECDKEKENENQETKTTKQSSSSAVGRRLLDEPVWRTYCNGKKCGFASKREFGCRERKILKAVEMVSMGAGVLPLANDDGKEEDEIMYMRAKFERVVGSRDSEAFYMMNPDSNGAPELSIYLLRV